LNTKATLFEMFRGICTHICLVHQVSSTSHDNYPPRLLRMTPHVCYFTSVTINKLNDTDYKYLYSSVFRFPEDKEWVYRSGGSVVITHRNNRLKLTAV